MILLSGVLPLSAWEMLNYIRYVKLNITVEFTNSAQVPEFKGSTLRGGLGDILLQEHCIGDLDCKTCDYSESCIVPNIYYHPLKIVPASVKDGGSLGYTFECPDRRTFVRRGDRMTFSLLLYGDVIVYFSCILDGLYRLGMNGIGQKKQAHFQILRITDQDGNFLFDHGNVNPRAIHVRNLMADAYKKAAERVESSGINHSEISIRFDSLWTQKWKGEFLKEFQPEAFAEACYRRVYLLHCLEGIPFPEHPCFDLSETKAVPLQRGIGTETRYSNTHHASIRLKGIEGKYRLSHVPKDFFPFLYAAEIVHVGKNTSLGFGKFTILNSD